MFVALKILWFFNCILMKLNFSLCTIKPNAMTVCMDGDMAGRVITICTRQRWVVEVSNTLSHQISQSLSDGFVILRNITKVFFLNMIYNCCWMTTGLTVPVEDFRLRRPFKNYAINWCLYSSPSKAMLNRLLVSEAFELFLKIIIYM